VEHPPRRRTTLSLGCSGIEPLRGLTLAWRVRADPKLLDRNSGEVPVHKTNGSLVLTVSSSGTAVFLARTGVLKREFSALCCLSRSGGRGPHPAETPTPVLDPSASESPAPSDGKQL
jgi:hypothetical protein